MKIYTKLTRVFTLHWFYLTFGQTSKSISRCSANATELMKEATVTCFFPDSVINKNFFVFHEENPVAYCMWTRGKPDCTVESGYGEDNQMVTNSFTLRIPQFFQNHTGKYRCVVGNDVKQECTLFQRTVPATSQAARQQKVTTAPFITLKGTSRCAAPTAELTKEATVTCLFPVDVRLSKADFTVYHEKETVADCFWISGRLECTLKTGYEQDDQMVTNSFTLRIPYFLQNHTGLYSCVLDGYDTEVCSLSKRTVSSLTPEISSIKQRIKCALNVSTWAHVQKQASAWSVSSIRRQCKFFARNLLRKLGTTSLQNCRKK